MMIVRKSILSKGGLNYIIYQSLKKFHIQIFKLDRAGSPHPNPWATGVNIVVTYEQWGLSQSHSSAQKFLVIRARSILRLRTQNIGYFFFSKKYICTDVGMTCICEGDDIDEEIPPFFYFFYFFLPARQNYRRIQTVEINDLL